MEGSCVALPDIYGFAYGWAYEDGAVALQQGVLGGQEIISVGY